MSTDRIGVFFAPFFQLLSIIDPIFKWCVFLFFVYFVSKGDETPCTLIERNKKALGSVHLPPGKGIVYVPSIEGRAHPISLTPFEKVAKHVCGFGPSKRFSMYCSLSQPHYVFFFVFLHHLLSWSSSGKGLSFLMDDCLAFARLRVRTLCAASCLLFRAHPHLILIAGFGLCIRCPDASSKQQSNDLPRRIGYVPHLAEG